MISAIVLTKNEEKNIAKCLESLKWCDEILVVDDNSTDKTIEVAKKYKATIYKHSLGSNFSLQRNFGISKAKNEWILFVDSDEVVSDALAYEITNAITLRDLSLGSFNGYCVSRKDFMWGKFLNRGESNIKLLRLGKKDKGLWEGSAHERWHIEGRVGNLTNSLQHFPHKNTEEFLKKINFYTDIRVDELKRRSVKVFFWQIITYPVGKFVFNYFIKLGILDGIRGLIFAIIMSFHSFLVRSKSWLQYIAGK